MRQNSGRETGRISPQIIFEDSNLLVLDKPSHLVVLPTSHYPDLEKTLAGFVFEHLGISIKNIGKENRFGFVHRLDRDTSGVILVAKTSEFWEFLVKQFEEHKVSKTYQALVWGDFDSQKILFHFDTPMYQSTSSLRIQVEDEWLVIRSFLDRNPSNTQQFTVSQTGGEAITQIKKLQSFQFLTPTKKFEPMSFLEIKPLTGRTHQIRVHLKALGYPVAGDWLYGGRKKFRWVKERGLDHQFLHAQKIEVPTPTGKSMIFEALMPVDLKMLLERCALAPIKILG
ncbi:MAG: Pseudouridine synthase [candidate division CPR1 bacterium GW2011_GWA2_42_17]|uniref:Pseudouridine synthase n=1 Tax=candidate division CPR1 bacterium GW2011_GWA2_42_17 TaxID=1618341 RepID=A0A0G1C2V5_9BACT|nr:MAG: Pseudouridine synthase [candidate division CPR1 bacterium GW2011_GWA2_42_17]